MISTQHPLNILDVHGLAECRKARLSAVSEILSRDTYTPMPSLNSALSITSKESLIILGRK